MTALSSRRTSACPLTSAFATLRLKRKPKDLERTFGAMAISVTRRSRQTCYCKEAVCACVCVCVRMNAFAWISRNWLYLSVSFPSFLFVHFFRLGPCALLSCPFPSGTSQSLSSTHRFFDRPRRPFPLTYCYFFLILSCLSLM